MSNPDGSRVFIQEGFRWDEQDAYLIDIDGTLLRHKDRVHFDAFYESVRGVMGRDLILDGVILAGNTDPGILRDAFRLANVDDAVWRPQREAVLKALCAKVTERREHLRPTIMPGVEATLEHLQKKGALLGIATGNLEEIGWLKIENAGLRSWFSFGGFSDQFEARADMIAHAADQARTILRSEWNSGGSDREFSVCVVGDTPFDIEAARVNGLPTIAVATGHSSFDTLMEHRPEACATTLAALLEATVGAGFAREGAGHAS
jgi:phosphoglycolate phosphatase-like HAD superfamily hydrolase